MTFPEPVISVAVEPKSKADQDKLSQGLARLSEEDPTFRVTTDEETGQTLIAGMGELHLEIIVDRLKREFNVDANVGRPQVAYRETISRAAENIRGKFVRQTGGSGQYGDVVINLYPQEPGAGYEFKDKIVGGKIPKEYIPPSTPASRRRWARASSPATRSWTSRSSLIDGSLPRRRLERARLQDRRLDGLQGGDEAGEADAARADDVRRGDDARGLPRRRDRQPQLPARTDRVDEPRRQRPGRQGDRAAVARCSATRPTCARCRRAGQRSTWISTTTRKFRNRSPARSSSRAAAAPKRVNGGRRNGKAEVRALEAARQRRHDRAHRPRQDHADRGDHEGARRAGRQHGRARLRVDRRRSRGAPARDHDQHRARRVRDGETATTRTSTARVTPTTSRT